MSTKTPTKRRAGIGDLTIEIVEAHVAALEDGLDIIAACAQIGHSNATYYKWASLGAAPDADDVHRAFHERVVTRRTPSRSTGVRLDHIPDRLTAAHFEEWAHGVTLDTGYPWIPETFQLDIVEDVLDNRTKETWAIIPEGNAKTTLMAGFGLYHVEHVPTATVPVGASSREQAEILFRQASDMIARSKGMGRRFKATEGQRRIRCLSTQGRIQIYAADERTGDGVIPTLALLEELHRHRDLRLYRVWRGKLKKRDGQIVAISTAGEPGSEFEETRDRILREAVESETEGARVRACGKGIVIHDWAVRDRSKCDDLEAVKAANPLAAITVDDLREKRDTPTMTPEHWLRFTCNVPTRISGQGITAEAWDRLREDGVEANREAWSIGFIDLGWEIDCSAIGVLVWESMERRVVAGVRIFEPPVQEADLVEHILDLTEEYRPVGFVYDPNAGGKQMAQQLESATNLQQVERGVGSIEFYEHPQEPVMMALAATRLDEAIRNGQLVHDGHAGLRRHALNVVKKPVGGSEKWRYDRPPDAKGERRKKYPIDALTGLVMGHSVAVAENEDVMPLVARV